MAHGPLLDLGPHVVDALDAALGPVVEIRAHGDPDRWVGLLLDHAGGASSEVSLTLRSGVEPMRAGLEVHTPEGVHAVDCAAAVDAEAFATMASEFAATVRSWTSHPLDLARGVHLQRLLDAAGRQLRRR